MIWAGRCSLCHVVNAESRLIFSQQASALSSGNKLVLFMHGFLRKILSTLSQAIYPNVLKCHEMNISCLVTKYTAEFGKLFPFHGKICINMKITTAHILRQNKCSVW